MAWWRGPGCTCHISSLLTCIVRPYMTLLPSHLTTNYTLHFQLTLLYPQNILLSIFWAAHLDESKNTLKQFVETCRFSMLKVIIWDILVLRMWHGTERIRIQCLIWVHQNVRFSFAFHYLLHAPPPILSIAFLSLHHEEYTQTWTLFWGPPPIFFSDFYQF